MKRLVSQKALDEAGRTPPSAASPLLYLYAEKPSLKIDPGFVVSCVTAYVDIHEYTAVTIKKNYSAPRLEHLRLDVLVLRTPNRC